MLLIFILLKLRDTGCHWYSSLNLIKLLKYLKYLVSQMFKWRQMQGLCLCSWFNTALWCFVQHKVIKLQRKKERVCQMFGCAEAMQMALNNKFTFECQFWKHLLKGINLNVCFLSRVSLLKFFQVVFCI